MEVPHHGRAQSVKFQQVVPNQWNFSKYYNIAPGTTLSTCLNRTDNCLFFLHKKKKKKKKKNNVVGTH